jgi:hypothetical protein
MVTELEKRGPWLSLWAKWMALRSGISKAASEVSRAELNLLPRWLHLEIESFGHYYGGRFRSGARLQKAAASCCGPEHHTQLYLRNNAAEFLSRGGYFFPTLAMVIEGRARAWNARRMRTHWSELAEAEWSNLGTTTLTVWPLGFLAAMGWMPRWLTNWLRRRANDVRGRDLDKFLVVTIISSPADTPEYEAALKWYEWLGQRHRLINLLRFRAHAYLRTYFRCGTTPTVREAIRASNKAARSAGAVGDRVRWAKCALLAAVACSIWHEDLGRIESSQVRDRKVERAWTDLRESEMSSWIIASAHAAYRLSRRCPRRWRRRLARAALAFMETS